MSNKSAACPARMKKSPFGDFFFSVRAPGIEPGRTAWKAIVLPLNHARICSCSETIVARNAG